MASKKKPATRRPTKGIADREAAQFEAAIEQLRADKATIRETVITTIEAAVFEQLLSDRGTFEEFRSRFPHGLKSIDANTLAKLRALLRGIVTALRENDVPAIEQAAGFFYPFMGIATEQAQLARAVELVGFASKRVREDDTVPAMLIFHLTAFDKRFGKPKGVKSATAETQKSVLDHVQTVLLAIRHDNARSDGKPKGGSRNLGPSGALAKIMATTGAFDAKSEKSALEKINNAVKRVRHAEARKLLLNVTAAAT